MPKTKVQRQPKSLPQTPASHSALSHRASVFPLLAKNKYFTAAAPTNNEDDVDQAHTYRHASAPIRHATQEARVHRYARRRTVGATPALVLTMAGLACALVCGGLAYLE